MPTLFWDASALAKRYAPEVGRPAVLALFTQVPLPRMLTTLWCYTETFALLKRKQNSGILPVSLFANAISALRSDLLGSSNFELLTVDDASIISSVYLIQRHNINSADAALLATWLRYVQAQPPGERASCVLVAADLRLLRAAEAEGLATLNPEVFPAADVAAFLTAL